MSSELAKRDQQEVVGPEPTLEELGSVPTDELGTRAFSEHLGLDAALAEAVERAICAGRFLTEARLRCEAGGVGWFDWLHENFGPGYDHFSTRDSREAVANFYIRVSFNAEKLRAANLPSLSTARIYMRNNRLMGPWTKHRGNRALGPGIAEEARALCVSGLTMEEAAAALGIAKSTVHRYVTPGQAEKQREAGRRSKARKRAAEVALREKRAREAARKLKGARYEAYAMAERMQDVLGQAHDESTDRQARGDWAIAGEHYRKMRDAIVRAVGADG